MGFNTNFWFLVAMERNYGIVEQLIVLITMELDFKDFLKVLLTNVYYTST